MSEAEDIPPMMWVEVCGDVGRALLESGVSVRSVMAVDPAGSGYPLDRPQAPVHGEPIPMDGYSPGVPLTDRDGDSVIFQGPLSLARRTIWAALPGRPYTYAGAPMRRRCGGGILVFHPDDEARVLEAMEDARRRIAMDAEAWAAPIARKAAGHHAGRGPFTLAELIACHRRDSPPMSTDAQRIALGDALEAAGFRCKCLVDDSGYTMGVWYR